LAIFSIRVNNDLDFETFVEVAAVAEAVGFDQLWVSHDLGLRSATVLLCGAVKETSKIKLGVGIRNPYSCSVGEICMDAATLQELSGGRFLLGIGAGSESLLRRFGIERRAPLSKVRETFLGCRELLRGVGVHESGSSLGPLLFSLGAAVPIYLGAMGPRMLQLGGELADGVIGLAFPPESFAYVKSEVEKGMLRREETSASFDLPACFWCSISEDPIEARQVMAEKLAFYGADFSEFQLSRAGISLKDLQALQAVAFSGTFEGLGSTVPEEVLKLGITGGVDVVMERCRGLLRMGARHLSFGPPLGRDVVEAVRVIGERIVSVLREESGDENQGYSACGI